jgi:hypothetical protein
MSPKQRRFHTWLAAALLCLGAALLTFMVTVEGEPGALPLGLLLAGTAWMVLARRRGGRRTDDRP